MTEVIVIGAGYAGLMAANRAASRGLRVQLVSEQGRYVDRIRLHEVIAGVRPPGRAARTPRLVPGVQLVAARAARVGEGWAELEDGRRLRARHIVLATGSGAGHGGWDWALRHRDALARLGDGQRVQVLGAGFTGLEVATEVAQARPDLQVHLVDPLPLGGAFSDAGRTHLQSTLDRLGISHDTQPGPADLSIPCTGLTSDALGADSGLPVDEAGAVLVDEHLRVEGAQGLWACGDGARLPAQPHLRAACATAEPMGAHVADQLTRVEAGEALRPLSLGYAMWCLSLGRSDGLIQYVRRDDRVTERALTGRPAAVAKELVCRGAVWAPMWASRAYRGMRGPQ